MEIEWKQCLWSALQRTELFLEQHNFLCFPSARSSNDHLIMITLPLWYTEEHKHLRGRWIPKLKLWNNICAPKILTWKAQNKGIENRQQKMFNCLSKLFHILNQESANQFPRGMCPWWFEKMVHSQVERSLIECGNVSVLLLEKCKPAKRHVKGEKKKVQEEKIMARS